MTGVNLLLILFILELLKNVLSFNPLLTYSFRYKKLRFNPEIFGNYTIQQYRDKQYINAYIKINTTDEINKVVVTFNRCNSEGINCEYFQSWTLNDICKILMDNNQMWSSWYGSFYPPMVCPIDKVNYEVRNGTFDIGPTLQWYPDATNYQWKVLQKMYSGDKFVGSFLVELQIFGYRKKTKSIF